MSEAFYRERLYPLQDEVLTVVGKTGSSFYLTGGTAVSRFMLNHRYSDDLDFFLNRSDRFRQEVEVQIEQLRSCGEVNLSFRSEDFMRIFLTRNEVQLKLEFVNDVKFRVGLPVRRESGFLIDTWQNILSNKITALSRNAAKDFADVLFLALNYSFNWEEMINSAKEKDAWVAEHEVANMLLGFDVKNLAEVSFAQHIPVTKITHDYFRILARDAFNGFDNSLVGKVI
ncbi:MAG: nucleotidyl transferase AbiEii/AbiGii toxin family protein [Cyclobacteriaceae bacterium]|nr:nucleotidyl transferase AbiEii/AbiGii toxin family protein [Cyclobacteriaceae bacterium]